MPKVRLADGSLVDIATTDLFDDTGQNPFIVPTPPTGATFTAEDIARARSEEKDKLYPRLEALTATVEALQGKLDPLTKAEEQRLAAAQAEQARLEEEARVAREAEMDPRTVAEQRIAEAQAQWQSQLAQVTSSLEASEAAREKERQFNEVRDYIADQVAAHTNPETGDVAPEFVQYITGNTKEEVDASIERAKASTASILEQFSQFAPAPEVDPATGLPLPQTVVPVVDPNAQVVVPGQPNFQAPPSFGGSRAWGGPPNDVQGQQTQTLTAQQIKDMPLEEYAKYRSRLGVAPKGQNHGLFG